MKPPDDGRSMSATLSRRFRTQTPSVESGDRRGAARLPRGVRAAPFSAIRSTPMTQPATISVDYTLRPSELAPVLALLVEARQATIVWGPPRAAKSMIAQQVAAAANRQYVDVRALLLDPVDLRGIPWRDGADRTRWRPARHRPGGAGALSRRCRAPRHRARARQCCRSGIPGPHREDRPMIRLLHGAPTQALSDALEEPLPGSRDGCRGRPSPTFRPNARTCTRCGHASTR